MSRTGYLPTGIGGTLNPVELAPMAQLAEARCDDDNWTGLKNQAERRKRQTRLALRSLRKRQAAQKQSIGGDVQDVPKRTIGEYVGARRISNHEENSLALSTRGLFIPSYIRHGGDKVPGRSLHQMSKDHLIPLIEYNVYRATLTNIMILGHLHLFHDTCGFHRPIPMFPNHYYHGGEVPISLRPTMLQQTSSYPDWIDILPSPMMRDNAIRSQHRFTNADLAAELMGGLLGLQQSPGYGMIVWSNPWEAGGWELTEGLLRKWWFLFQGCDDLIHATNKWRRLRGEKPLLCSAPGRIVSEPVVPNDQNTKNPRC